MQLIPFELAYHTSEPCLNMQTGFNWKHPIMLVNSSCLYKSPNAESINSTYLGGFQRTPQRKLLTYAPLIDARSLASILRVHSRAYDNTRYTVTTWTTRLTSQTHLQSIHGYTRPSHGHKSQPRLHHTKVTLTWYLRPLRSSIQLLVMLWNT
jgi:hypothetical protein